MASNRVKVFASLNSGGPPSWGSIPSTDGFVDIDSVQTVSNKTFVNASATGNVSGPFVLAMNDTSGTRTVSGPGQANISYNAVTNLVEVSYNGTPYTSLGAGSVLLSDVQRKLRLLLKVAMGGLGISQATILGIGGATLWQEALLGQQTI